MPTSNVPEISVHELKERLESDDDLLLLDVRQPDEYEIANLDGELIPLGELPERLNELDDYRDKSVVVYCRSGRRSAKAVAYMRGQGFDRAVNLRGGINAWSEEIDPSMPTY